MPRGKKKTAVVLHCKECNTVTKHLYINKATKPEEGLKKYCSTCRKRTESKMKDAKNSAKK